MSSYTKPQNNYGVRLELAPVSPWFIIKIIQLNSKQRNPLLSTKTKTNKYMKSTIT